MQAQKGQQNYNAKNAHWVVRETTKPQAKVTVAEVAVMFAFYEAGHTLSWKEIFCNLFVFTMCSAAEVQC